MNFNTGVFTAQEPGIYRYEIAVAVNAKGVIYSLTVLQVHL